MAPLKPQSTSKFSTTHERMIRAVVNFTLYSENVVITQSVVAFYALMLTVKDNLSTVDHLRSLASKPITGFAAEVNASKEKLAQTSASIMNAVHVYAIEEGNA